MCGGSAPKAPTPPPVTPEEPKMPETSTAEGVSNRDRRRRAAAAGRGNTGTILTGPRGVQNSATTNQKTLLGQ